MSLLAFERVFCWFHVMHATSSNRDARQEINEPRFQAPASRLSGRSQGARGRSPSRGGGLLFRAAFLIGLLVSATHAADWPQWRGADGTGISQDTNVPVEWSPTQNVLWKASIPGEGHSSPIVVGGSVFLTTALKESGERLLLRLDANTGALLWRAHVLTAPIESMHRENSAASSNPVTDGEFVYTSFQNGTRVDIQCFDFTGKRIWSAQPLRFEGQHGYSYTPIIHESLLIFDFAQNDESAVIALDKASGQVRWRFERGEREISHVTPLIVTAAGKKQLIVCGANEIRSFDPSSGKSIWWAEGPTEVCVAGLTFGENTVFATGGYSRRTRMAVNVTGTGNVSSSHVVWSTGREVTYVPSPVYHEGFLYTVLDEGMLYCFDAKTGKAVWDQRLGGRYRSSLVMAGDRIYATNDKGRTTVFRASSVSFEKIAENDLNEFCYTTPAISKGRLFLRTGNHLYCFANGGPPAGGQ
jgi:outer membrane protein assembly factor BamB